MGAAPPALSLPALVTGAFLVSLATVAVPGPITLVASRLALRRLPAAVWFLLGVTALDVVLFVALAAGAGPLVRAIGDIPIFEVIGGLALVWAGIAALRPLPKPQPSAAPDAPQARSGAMYFLLGVAVAAGNPQYWFWWFTAGIALIQAARAHGAGGLAWMLVALIAGVAVWYVPLLTAVDRGKKLLSPRAEAAILKGLAVVMVVLGAALVVVGIGRL